MSNSVAADVNKEIDALVDAWCERRAIGPLREILACYPLVSNLTDEWASLASALKTIRVKHINDLEPSEMDSVVKVQHLAEAVVYR